MLVCEILVLELSDEKLADYMKKSQNDLQRRASSLIPTSKNERKRHNRNKGWQQARMKRISR